MSFIARYSSNAKGAIVITGNTLGLSRRALTLSPGTDNAINQFITTNIDQAVPTEWSQVANLNNGENITYDWRENSSSANLNILFGSRVLYAELIWGGLSAALQRDGSVDDVTQYIDNDITLTVDGQTYFISPDPATSQTIVTTGATFYTRSAKVTDIVTIFGSGKYTVGAVPSAIERNASDTLNHAGWTLIVAYANDELPPRNMNVYVGEEVISSGSYKDITLDGFLTPVSGDISARISIGAQEGDAVHTGDQILFGRSEATLRPLSGPNNPEKNFFGSQINIGDPNNENVGNLDITGTFGGRNANAQAGTNTTAGRQGWDITNVDGSDALVNNQSSALVRLTTNGDIYAVNTVGIQIDTILITPVKTVDKEFANPGDTITYTVNLLNEGATPQTVTFTDPAPEGTTYIDGSLDVSTTYSGDLINGIVVRILPYRTVQIQWQVQVEASIPIENPIQNTGVVGVEGLPNSNTNTVETIILTADKMVTKTAIQAEFTPGQLATYSITVTNNGPYAAQSVEVDDDLVDAIEDPEYSTDQGATWYAWTGTLGLNTLGVNQSVTFLIRGTLSVLQTEDVANTVIVTSTTADPNPDNDTVTITTPLAASADVSVIKTGPATIHAGDGIRYSIVVSNAGPSIAQGVELTDTLSTADFNNVEYSINNGQNWSAWSSPLIIGTLDVGMSQRILIRARVNSNVIENLSNTASVSATTPDPDLTNNTSTVVTTLTTLADISVAKIPDTLLPLQGTELIYSIVVNNAGPSDAQAIILTDMMPAELLDQQYSTVDRTGPWVACPADGQYNLGNLANGNSVTIYLKGTTTTPDTITNQASVLAVTPDPNLENNTSVAVTQQQNAILQVSKIAEPKPVYAGNQITYQIVVSNNSAVVAYNVTVTDPVLMLLEDQEYQMDGETDWNLWNGTLILNTIDANSSKAFSIRGRVPSGTAPGNIENTVTVTSTNADTVTDTDITTIVAQADIYVLKVGVPQPVNAGQKMMYTMLVGNNGPSDATGVQLFDEIPGVILNPQASINGAAFTNITSPYNAALGTITQGGELVSVRVRGRLASDTVTDFTNVVRVSTTTPEAILTNNTASFTSTVTACADLKIGKEINMNPIIAGSEIIYTITITNEGISAAQDVTLNDTLDPRINDPMYALSLDGPWTEWTGSVSLGTLAANDTVIVYMKGTVESSATGEVVNTAEVISTTPDGKPEDSTVTIVTPIIVSADVEIIKTVLTNPAVAGSQVMFKELVINHGPSDAIGVVLIDVVRTNIIDLMYSSNGGVTWMNWTSSLVIGDLAAGNQLEFLLKGMLEEETDKDMENTAIVRATTPDPYPDNNISTAVLEVSTLADLEVKKIRAHNTPEAGEYLIHMIVVVNHGPSSAYQAVLEDEIPKGINDPEYSLDGGTTWMEWNGRISAPVIPAGTMATVLIRGIVDTSVQGQELRNTATIDSQTPDPDRSNNSSTVVTVPGVTGIVDVMITKTDMSVPVTVGGMLTYTLTVSNISTQDAENVVIVDRIPMNLGQMQYSEDSTISWNTWNAWNTWNGEYEVGTLAAGDSRILRLRGIVTDMGNSYVLNTAMVTTSSPETNLENNIAVVVTPILSPDPDPTPTPTPTPIQPACPPLSICQCVNIQRACISHPIMFSVFIYNQGMVQITNAMLTGVSSSALTNLMYSLDCGCTWNCWNQYCALNTLEPTSVTEVQFCGMVENTNDSYLTHAVQLYVGYDTMDEWMSVIRIPIIR